MNYIDLPLPEAKELPFDSGWALWDKAKQEQDSGFAQLSPMEQDEFREKLARAGFIESAVSERSVMRAEKQA